MIDELTFFAGSSNPSLADEIGGTSVNRSKGLSHTRLSRVSVVCSWSGGSDRQGDGR